MITRSKIVLVVLLLSLSINLFLVGGIIYRVSAIQEFGPRPFPPNISWIVRDLSQTRQEELAPLLEDHRSEVNPLRRQMFEAQRQVNELMSAADFDEPALVKAFSELRKAAEAYQALSHAQTVSMLSELTPTEREAARRFVQRRGPRDGFRGQRPAERERNSNEYRLPRPPANDGDIN